MSVDLNIKQLEVINELTKNIFLVAPAGTGKTNTLAKRISKIISNDKCKGEEILCITFTNKACKEMQERVINELSIDEDLLKEGKKITIKTFHGFCLQIIKEEAKKNTDIFTDFTVYDEEDSLETLKILKYYFKYPLKILKKFVDVIKEKRCEYGFITIDEVVDYRNTINEFVKIERHKFEEIASLDYKYNEEIAKNLYKSGVHYIRAYNRELSNNHALDFNDLILNMKKLFLKDNIVEKIRRKYKYINIDEVQDTSFVEYEIIKKLFYGNNVLLSGDRFQTIYSWRGSEPKRIQVDFIDEFKPRVVNFNKSYRGTKILTEASREYLKNVSREEFEEVYKEGICANSKVTGEKIRVKACKDQDGEANFIMENINDIIRNQGDLSSTCILTRDNNYSIELSKNLNNKSKPSEFEFILVDEYKFFRRSEIKDVIAFLKLIINNSDATSLKRILLRLKTGIGEETIKKILDKECRESGIKLTDFIDDRCSSGEYFSMLLQELERDNIVVFDVESTGTDVTEDQIIQIAAIRINKKGEVIEKFERFIKPTKSVGSSYVVHGFSDEMLMEIGEEKEKVFKDFIEFSKGRLIVGHNVQYDINIFNSELSRTGMEGHKFLNYYDTLDIYRRFYPNEKNHKLEYLSRVFDTKHKPSHNAMDDIIATGELLVMAINNKIKETSIMRFSYMQKYLKSFSDISRELNELFEYSKNHMPDDIIIEVLKRFDLFRLYQKDEIESKKDRIIHFHNLVRELNDGDKNYRDSLIEVVNLTSLSNGEIEEIMIKKTGVIRIPIITVHQSKGLEFENVFLAGLYDTKFPSYLAIKSGDLREERRLFYVGITRAKKRLFLSYPKMVLRKNRAPRNVFESPFLKSIPKEFIR